MWKWPKIEGLGILLIVVLGAFILLVWFEVFIGGSLACAPGESNVECGREWLAILLPTIGLIGSVWVSARLILKQINAEPRNFYPPAIDYLTQQNINVTQLQDIANDFVIRLKYWLETIKTDKIEESDKLKKEVIKFEDIVEKKDYRSIIMKFHHNTFEENNVFYKCFFVTPRYLAIALSRYDSAVVNRDFDLQKDAVRIVKTYMTNTVYDLELALGKMAVTLAANTMRLSEVHQAITDEVDEILRSRDID